MWRKIEFAPLNTSVMTKVDDHNGCRNEKIMVKRNNLWWAGDIYVYYEPTHFRYLTEEEKQGK
jgi:hypothetical protein